MDPLESVDHRERARRTSFQPTEKLNRDGVAMISATTKPNEKLSSTWDLSKDAEISQVGAISYLSLERGTGEQGTPSFADGFPQKTNSTFFTPSRMGRTAIDISRTSARDPRLRWYQQRAGNVNERIGWVDSQDRSLGLSPKVDSLPTTIERPLAMGKMSSNPSCTASLGPYGGNTNAVDHQAAVAHTRQGADPGDAPSISNNCPPKDQMGSQPWFDDPNTQEAALDFANRFPRIVDAAIELYSSMPNVSPNEFKELVEAEVNGSIACPAILGLDIHHLKEFYMVYSKKEKILPSEYGALLALERAMNIAGRDLMRSTGRKIGTVSNVEGDNRGKQEMHKEMKSPSFINVVCNGNKGIFDVQEQTVSCMCPACKHLAAEKNIPHLNILPMTFVRHSGMKNSKKWKNWIRTDDDTSTPIGHVLEVYGLGDRPRNYTQREDDDLVEKMDSDRQQGFPVLEGPPNGLKPPKISSEPHNHDLGATESGDNSGASDRPVLHGAARRKPKASVLREQHSAAVAASPLVASDEGAEGASGSLGDGEGRRIPSLRARRKRKAPAWMEQTINPEAIAEDGNQTRLSRLADVSKQGNDLMPTTEHAQGTMIMPNSDALFAALDAIGCSSQEMDPACLDRNDEMGNAKVKKGSKSTLEDAVMKGECPEIVQWSLAGASKLKIALKLNDVIFEGILPAATRSSGPRGDERLSSKAKQLVKAIVSAADESNMKKRHQSLVENLEEHGDFDKEKTMDMFAQLNDHNRKDRSDDVVPVRNDIDTPAQPRHASHQRHKPAVSDRRRDKANAEYERMLILGPPKGTECTLCHIKDADFVPGYSRGLGGRSDSGLGKLVLVRTTAIQNAWVHDQCIRWSPEVHDPVGNGVLKGVKEAIRRGRMLKCRVCGKKGATLGCLKSSCKYSYHLPCARAYGCALNVDPYTVACPEHVKQLPDELLCKISLNDRSSKRFKGKQPCVGHGSTPNANVSSKRQNMRQTNSKSRNHGVEEQDTIDGEPGSDGNDGGDARGSSEQVGKTSVSDVHDGRKDKEKEGFQHVGDFIKRNENETRIASVKHGEAYHEDDGRGNLRTLQPAIDSNVLAAGATPQPWFNSNIASSRSLDMRADQTAEQSKGKGLVDTENLQSQMGNMEEANRKPRDDDGQVLITCRDNDKDIVWEGQQEDGMGFLEEGMFHAKKEIMAQANGEQKLMMDLDDMHQHGIEDPQDFSFDVENEERIAIGEDTYALDFHPKDIRHQVQNYLHDKNVQEATERMKAMENSEWNGIESFLKMENDTFNGNDLQSGDDSGRSFSPGDFEIDLTMDE